MVREIMERYDVDAIKFGGGSFGFSGQICYCHRCKAQYAEANGGKPLPPARDWDDPNWCEYFKWQQQKTVETVARLNAIVKAVDPTMPVLGNATAFGDPRWTMTSPLDMEKIAQVQDLLQVEIQERVHAKQQGEAWQSLTFPAESANIMANITDKPVFSVASYFLGWPWRRVAMPYAEQKVYLAQVVANGGSPMVNLSGGPMKTHEDQRGFRAISELYNYVLDNRAYIWGDKSGARVALVYSQDTLSRYGRDGAMHKYVHHLRGWEQAMDELHIPYDILSIRGLGSEVTEKYDVLILANTAVMSEAEAGVINRFTDRGGCVIATFMTSLYDPEGHAREDFLLGDLFGVKYLGVEPVDRLDPQVAAMAYQELDPAMINGVDGALLSSFEGTSLLPAYGLYCKVSLKGDARSVMQYGPAMQVFPEGLAYPLHKGKGFSSIVARDLPAGGKAIYFTGQADKAFFQVKVPDLKRLLGNAIAVCESRLRPLRAKAPKSVLATIREKDGMRMAHLINLTGGGRFFEETIPVGPIEVGLPVSGGAGPKAMLLSTRQPLPVCVRDGYAWAELDRLVDYDVIVFED